MFPISNVYVYCARKSVLIKVNHNIKSSVFNAKLEKKPIYYKRNFNEKKNKTK